MDNLWSSLVTIATAITGVAIIAVIVSRNAQTPEVLRAAGSAFSSSLAVAVSPVTGSKFVGFTGNSVSIGNGNQVF